MLAKIPKIVLLSVAMLLAAHAAGLLEMVQLSRTLDVSIWMPYSALALVYSLLAALLTLILLGKRLARAVYTFLAVISLLSAVIHFADLSAEGLLVATAKLVAVVLLYVPASNRWFNRGSPNNSFKPTPLRGAA
ncbi:MAG: hypothetical protein EOP50_00940 [Sphingobacteriales bacterium]|nr:MAG: hypothetical protein EOP50_00940 [Sphingobacteriales bacterium]